jgi:rSAM/selenodomain-associated transferase 1
VVVLAKYPTVGRVKTRLAAALGADAACTLYRACVRDLARRLRRVPLRVWWAFTPASAPFGSLVRSRRCFPQRGGDLGSRIHHALRTTMARTGGPVLAIGADAPHVSVRELLRAARALERGADVVFGPSHDGGYWLIGVRRPRRALFDGIPWSTSRVAAATRRRCRVHRLSCVEVAADFDIDEPTDLAALGAIVRRRRSEFPSLRVTLRRLSRRA